MKIKAQIDRMVGENNRIKAYASVILGGEYVVRDIAVMDSKNGLFARMPYRSYKDRNGDKAAYGYELIDGQLYINEAEAVVIRRIFDLYLQGCGKQAIANQLNANGIPRRYRRTQSRMPLCA